MSAWILRCSSTLVAVAALSLFETSALAAEVSFQFVDGDRVVLVGNTLVEREQSHSYLETVLLSRSVAKDVTFRNLGWSGDTVWGHARAVFGSPEDGFRDLVAHTKSLTPTVIVVAYGMNESFEGEAALKNFVSGLDGLLKALGDTKARIVLVGPNRHEHLPPPLPDPTAHNKQLRLYADAMKKLAADRGLPFVDLYELLPDGTKSQPPQPLTDNGIHYTAYGYWRLADAFARGVNLPQAEWKVELSATGAAPTATGTKLRDVKVAPTGVRFKALDAQLPLPPAPKGSPAATLSASTLKVTGLAAGNYQLKIDGQLVATGSTDDWSKGVAISTGPQFDQTEKLRAAVLEKNSLYFHRWRPQNWTYLFGFRKHEQGQNAKEIPKFDPLVTAKDAEISKLRTPTPHAYELLKAP